MIMDHLDTISVEDLQQTLAEVEGKKPTKRILAAIAYKNGITQTELAEWYGVERRTIYSWLQRLERGAIEQAVYDAHRSGRPRKLTSEQQNTLESVLHESPQQVGYDAPTWTPELTGKYINDMFNIDYSLPSCRRLMKEIGLSYRTPRRSVTNSDLEGTIKTNKKHWLPE
jgi:transposase